MNESAVISSAFENRREAGLVRTKLKIKYDSY